MASPTQLHPTSSSARAADDHAASTTPSVSEKVPFSAVVTSTLSLFETVGTQEVFNTSKQSTGTIDRSGDYSAILSTFSTNCPLLRLEHQHIFQDQALPVRTRLWDHAQRAQWRGLSLSPEGHGMSPPSLCWARTNSPVNCEHT